MVSGGKSWWFASGRDGLKGSLGAVLGTTRDLNLEKLFGRSFQIPFLPVLLMLILGFWAIITHTAQGTFMFHKPALLMPVGIEPQGYPRGFLSIISVSGKALCSE